MKAYLNDIRIWMRQYKLQLNEDKTEFAITPPRHAHKVTISTIRIGECEGGASKRAAEKVLYAFISSKLDIGSS